MKKCLLVLAASIAMSGIAAAAPVTNLEKGETTAGYLYWNPKVEIRSYDFGSHNANGFFVETALTDKVIVGIETIKGDASAVISGVYGSADTRFTDVTIQYKVANNIRLIAGNRNYDTNGSTAGASASLSENKLLYGISGSTVLGEKTTAYASVLQNSIGTDWQIGVNQNVSENLTLNVNYRYYDEDSFLDTKLKGVGAGIIYKF
ncbi:outer membrane protein with beta-barrel domain [Anaerospora hongkongensis]|uniref:Outer membrane protein with beta-barrel domain n=1 Tax=Anaerospora hongkongensis TaxID=244830 RepID=A0A4R1Q048_9FIRM|nr:outer membrane beta-barrel protein [Anaerospora hongkongensis]TCL38693.1 outer membrane protein with beta-barrel domain [Anaerospora hongkongensis]